MFDTGGRGAFFFGDVHDIQWNPSIVATIGE